jgi:flagellar basal body-associated protein FliL
VKHKDARQLIVLLVVVAVVSFVAGYFVMLRFIG